MANEIPHRAFRPSKRTVRLVYCCRFIALLVSRLIVAAAACLPAAHAAVEREKEGIQWRQEKQIQRHYQLHCAGQRM